MVRLQPGVDKQDIKAKLNDALQAGIRTKFLYVDEIGITGDGRFTDLDNEVLTERSMSVPVPC